MSDINYTSHKKTAAQSDDALSCHRVRGLYFQSVVFVATIVTFRKSITTFEVSTRSML